MPGRDAGKPVIWLNIYTSSLGVTSIAARERGSLPDSAPERLEREPYFITV